jgi:hypothetical protein
VPHTHNPLSYDNTGRTKFRLGTLFADISIYLQKVCHPIFPPKNSKKKAIFQFFSQGPPGVKHKKFVHASQNTKLAKE